MIVQCCQCHKVRLGPDWVEPNKPGVIPEASHGYCPRCESLAYEALREYSARNNEGLREAI